MKKQRKEHWLISMKNLCRKNMINPYKCYVIYDDKELPICYADTLEEVSKFAGKTKNAIANMFWRQKNSNTRAGLIIDGKHCFVKRFKRL
jgi:3-methyladenine DNA glycosylase AlkD